MFEDEKIDFIESLPEADAILITWIKLLTLAGKCNAGGFVFLTEKIPYTVEMLAHKFRRPLNTIKLALETLARLEMIQFDEQEFLKITNWEKHQNIAGLERIREQTRKRVAAHREREKLKESKEDVTLHVTQGNATELELEEELEEELDIEEELELEDGSSCSFDKNFKEIATLYQQVIGQPNALTPGWISSILEDYGFDWVKNAMLEAEKRGKRNKKYIEGILENWKNEGGMKFKGDGYSGANKGNDDEGLGQYADIGIKL